MTRKQMLRLIGKRPTLATALRVAILKITTLPEYWDKLIAEKASKHWPSKPNCPMCEYIKIHKLRCRDCIVGLHRLSHCDHRYSPYWAINRAIETKDKVLFKTARSALLIVLKLGLHNILGVRK